MGDSETLNLEAESTPEAKFDSAAQWGADSESHEPAEAGNDAHGAEAAGDIARASDAEPVGAAGETPSAPVEEPVRNEQGQFVKKGKGKPRSDPQARVEAATAKEAAAKEEARQAREELERLRTRLAEQERRATLGGQPPISAPPAQPQSFPSFDEWSKGKQNPEWDVYNDERTEWKANLIANRVAAQQIQNWQAQQVFQTKAQTYQQRVTEGAAKIPDFANLLQQADQAVIPRLAQYGMTQYPPIFQAALLESERPADVLHYLASHTDEAIQLAVEWHDAPVSAARSFRTVLESRLAPTAVPSPDSAPAAPLSSAKPPINRVGGSANAVPVDPEDLEFGPEYIRAENERERKRAGMGRW